MFGNTAGRSNSLAPGFPGGGRGVRGSIAKILVTVVVAGALNSLPGVALAQSGCCFCAGCGAYQPEPFCFDAVSFSACVSFCRQHAFGCQPQFGTNQSCGGGCASHAPIPTLTPTVTPTVTPTPIPTPTTRWCCQYQTNCDELDPWEVTSSPPNCIKHVPHGTPIAEAACINDRCVTYAPTRVPTSTPTLTPTIPADYAIDHFRCYKAKASEIRFGAKLTDVHFGDVETFTSAGAKPAFFCDPVKVEEPSKTPVPVRNPYDKLLCYELGDNSPRFESRSVQVRNRIGSPQVMVKSPKMICIPSRIGQ